MRYTTHMSDAHGGGSALPLFGLVEGQLHGAHGGGIHLQGRPIIIGFIVILFAFLIISPAQTAANMTFAAFTAPLWLTPIMVRFAILRFLYFRRAENIAKQDHVLLELRLPRDTMKTPVAMEAVLSAIHLGPGETNWYKKLMGGVRPWYSLEIVSLGGRVHFYVHCREGFRRAVESAFYAQFPNMEIVEAVDYSRLVDPAHDPYMMTGFEYAHARSDAWPIKTYVDFGLDKPQKPEEQTDPLAQIIELLGSLGPNEQFWLQLVIRTNKNEKYRNKKKPDGSLYTFSDEANKEVEAVRAATVRKTTRVDPVTGAATEMESFPNPTKGEQEGIWAIQRKQGKLTFDVGIRAIYSAPASDYKGVMGAYMVGLFKPFSYDAKGNTLALQDRFSARFGNYPWDDPGGHHSDHARHEIAEYYRRRAYFYDPYRGDWSIMSTEEIATLFHIPSSTIATPGLPRIGSSTGGTPVNLPT